MNCRMDWKQSENGKGRGAARNIFQRNIIEKKIEIGEGIYT